MKNFVITTDSNSDLPKAFIETHNITIIPQYYGFEDEVYGDEKNLTPAQFYQNMREGMMPTSMANNPAVIEAKFETLLQAELDILHIAFSSQLSGSCNNVNMVATQLREKYPQRVIEVVDSCTGSLGEGLLVFRAYDLKKEGKTLLEIKEVLDAEKSQIRVEFTVDDLHHLQKGGRISKTTAFVGSMVQIKPLLSIDTDGKLNPSGKARGRKKSFSALIDHLIAESSEHYGDKPICIIHGDCMPEASHVAKLLEERAGCSNVIINDVSPSIGTHAGPGVLGLCYWSNANPK